MSSLKTECMYVYMYVYVCICIYIYISYIYIHIYSPQHRARIKHMDDFLVFERTCVYVCTYIHVHQTLGVNKLQCVLCAHICPYHTVHTNIHTYIHIHTYVICMYAAFAKRQLHTSMNVQLIKFLSCLVDRAQRPDLP
jgi:hypothetical protein